MLRDFSTSKCINHRNSMMVQMSIMHLTNVLIDLLQFEIIVFSDRLPDIHQHSCDTEDIEFDMEGVKH